MTEISFASKLNLLRQADKIHKYDEIFHCVQRISCIIDFKILTWEVHKFIENKSEMTSEWLVYISIS